MKISDTTFVIEVNGFVGDPAKALRDYLLGHKAKKVTVISHPLVAEGPGKHSVTVYESGKQVGFKEYKRPNKPPYTFVLDPVVPARPPRGDVWFCFNNLSTLKGLRQRKLGKAKKVVYWAVDFVPGRFGNNQLTKVYDRFDKKAATQADARIDLSQAALEGRAKYLNLDPKTAIPAMVVPMGSWAQKAPKTGVKNLAKNDLVYLGHIVERQGVKTFIEALAILDKKGYKFTADVIGSGPMLDEVTKLASKLGLSKKVTFHGFVEDFGVVEKMLANATLGVAPYVRDESSFTQFADPGKLKSYLGAGLPIVLTDIPPNAHELEAAGLAKVVDDTPEAFASAIMKMTDKNAWPKHHEAALRYGKQFDWENLLRTALKKIDLE